MVVIDGSQSEGGVVGNKRGLVKVQGWGFVSSKVACSRR
jgi:hypothetical protein